MKYTDPPMVSRHSERFWQYKGVNNEGYCIHIRIYEHDSDGSYTYEYKQLLNRAERQISCLKFNLTAKATMVTLDMLKSIKTIKEKK